MVDRRFLGRVACAGLMLLASAWVVAAEPTKDDAEMKAFQGTWVSKDPTGESTWIFKDDTLKLTTPTRKYEITFKVDSKAKPLKEIDLKVTEDSPNSKSYFAPGIYKIDDKGVLSICFGDEKVGRPKEFKMEFGVSFLFELSKEKK